MPIEYGQFIKLVDETDQSQNVVKVRALMYYPGPDGKPRGISERITYNNQGMPISWDYPLFTNKQIAASGSNFVLVDAG